jgi:hypothetical protein
MKQTCNVTNGYSYFFSQKTENRKRYENVARGRISGIFSGFTSSSEGQILTIFSFPEDLPHWQKNLIGP